MNPTQKRAIKLAQKYSNNQTLNTKIAIQCGLALIKVQEKLPHGVFIEWTNENMPIRYVQCIVFMRIARIPGLLKLPKLLSIQSEDMLRKENKKTVNYIRKLNDKHGLSQREVRTLLKKPTTIMGDIRHIKTLITTLSNKVNKVINLNALSKQEKLEVASELRKIIKATK